LPQLPTTCFSRTPSSLPMWAHYAQNSEGFVLEIDESVLASRYPESGFGDVEYRSGPDERLNEALASAFVTAKPRHTYLLRRAVFSAAYYTKSEQWAYEQERRMVASHEEVRNLGAFLLLDCPSEAITAVICGARASEDTRRHLIARAASLGSRFLDMKVARTSIAPYFVDASNRAWRFSGGQLTKVERQCGKCGEPTEASESTCSLCAVHESHRVDAAMRNPYRLLYNLGMLPGYVRDMDRISNDGSATTTARLPQAP
jgi:hypothetical protein